eukprot:m.127983 g.127983  ORF g.127983 m.127983 type:complete len:89 (-) comp9740_c1_seq4:2077-2343(-)
MAFTAKYGNGDEIGTDDECAKALRDAGFKIVRFGDSGLVYVGQTDYDDKPDGTAAPSGSSLECLFLALIPVPYHVLNCRPWLHVPPIR